jgi:hypothetical protein
VPFYNRRHTESVIRALESHFFPDRNYGPFPPKKPNKTWNNLHSIMVHLVGCMRTLPDKRRTICNLS